MIITKCPQRWISPAGLSSPVFLIHSQELRGYPRADLKRLQGLQRVNKKRKWHIFKRNTEYTWHLVKNTSSQGLNQESPNF